MASPVVVVMRSVSKVFARLVLINVTPCGEKVRQDLASYKIAWDVWNHFHARHIYGQSEY